jgi:S1-C subfamily serine protease
VLALEVNIKPGNSGSPVLSGGSVVGIVDSLSLSLPSTAYAIPTSIVTEDLAKVPAHSSVSTMGRLP